MARVGIDMHPCLMVDFGSTYTKVTAFDIDSKTAESIHRNKSLLHNIAKERIYSEFSILLCGKSAAGVIRHFYDVVCEFIPEIQKAVDFRQNSRYHIYDVFTHTLVVMDNVKPDLILRLAALFHDIGKPYCYTQDEDGTGHFHGHGKVGSEMARTILKRLKADNSTAETVARLVLEHDIKIEDYSERALKRFLSGRTREYVKLLTSYLSQCMDLLEKMGSYRLFSIHSAFVIPEQDTSAVCLQWTKTSQKSLCCWTI